MNKKEKIIMGAITLLCPPVGLWGWFKLHKLEEQHAKELEDIITKGFGGIAEALEPKNHEKDV